MNFWSCLPTFSLSVSMYSVHLIPFLYISDPTSTLATSSTTSMSCSCLKIKHRNQLIRITLENVIIGLRFPRMVFEYSACSLTMQKLHGGPFLELKYSKSPGSMLQPVTLYRPSSRSRWAKSSFKVSGRLLMSRPSSSTT